MEMRFFASRLKSRLLPTLGRPTMATVRFIERREARGDGREGKACFAFLAYRLVPRASHPRAEPTIGWQRQKARGERREGKACGLLPHAFRPSPRAWSDSTNRSMRVQASMSCS